MTQEERWMVRYNEVMDFMENNQRNPSKDQGDRNFYTQYIPSKIVI